MNIDYIKKLIVKLGFAPQDGISGVFVKRYVAYDNYPIFVDFNEQKIEYAHQSIQQNKRIRLGDLTTSNFDKLENFVVLECIDRLLTKGYRPERLELEKKYPLGRNLKGKLDILIYNENDDFPFLMIECKTWGNEFVKESVKTLKDGGQIFHIISKTEPQSFCVCMPRTLMIKRLNTEIILFWLKTLGMICPAQRIFMIIGIRTSKKMESLRNMPHHMI